MPLPPAVRDSVSDAPQELLEFYSPTSAVLVTPISRNVLRIIWLFGTLIMTLIVASMVWPIAIVVSAPGAILPREDTIVVSPFETSIVRAIKVKEGDVVHAGQVLAVLDPTFAGSDEAMYQSQVDSLQAWVDRLRAELAKKPYQPAKSTPDSTLQLALYTQRKAAFDFQVESYDHQIEMYRAQVAQATSDIQVYSQRLKVQTELEAVRLKLEKLQVGSQIDRLMATDSRIELSRNLADAVAQQQQAQKNLDGVVATRDYYVNNWYAQASQDLRDQSSNLSDAREALEKARLRHKIVEMRADRDAYVLQVAQASVGSILQPGNALISLVPSNAHLEVEADVPASQSGYVQVGNPTTLKFASFDFIQYGTAEGKVRSVSADSFTAMGDLAQIGSVPNSGQPVPPFYKARITIDKVAMHDIPGGFHLVPGMPLTADIRVGTRTAFSYLFDRVFQTPLGRDEAK